MRFAILRRLTLVAGLALVTTGFARAAEGEMLTGDAYEVVDATVKAGDGLLLGPFATTTSRCHKSSDAKAWILQAPRHGRASVSRRRGEIAYGDDHQYAHCNDRLIKSTMVGYRPHPGFAGEDSFVFAIRFKDGEVRQKRVNVEVQ